MDQTEERVYEQANENWRFLAKWRQMAFAGHLTVLAATLSFASSAADHGYSQILIGLCFLFAAGVGPIFWIADRRTHRLTMHACRAGLELENGKPGFFRVNAILDREESVRHDLNRGWRRMDSHSKAATLLFIGSSVVCFAVAAIVMFTGVVASQRPTTIVWNYTIIHGPVTVNNPANSSASLGDQLSQATADGWEFVSTGTDQSIGAFIIVRRSKDYKK